MRFDLAGSNDRELPLILGLMPVLAQHAVDPDTFEETTFAPPVGSGPYLVGEVDPGKSVTFKRNPDYWGRDLPINRGFWNFDEIRLRLSTATPTPISKRSRRASIDLRGEARSETLGNRLRFSRPARRPRRQGSAAHRLAEAGMRASSSIPGARSSPISACARRSRCCSTSNGSTTISSSTATAAPRAISKAPSSSASGRPADARERALLAPFPDAVRADMLDGTWSPPATDGSGRDRDRAQRALALFAAAGYELEGDGTARARAADGRFASKFMVTTKDQERLALAFSRDLKRAGIDGARAPGRRGAIRPPPAHLRFRHDPEPLGPIALARQRAGVLLGLGRRRANRARATTWASRARPSTP